MPKFTEQWMPKEQIDLINRCYDKVKDLEGNVVELGCWQGKSTVGIANHIYPEDIICVDHWKGNTYEDPNHISVKLLQKRNVYEEFEANMEIGTKKNYQVYKLDCFDFLGSFKGKIKLLHIDADHHYDSVFKSIQLAKPLMVDGGCICGDDFTTQQGVRDAVIESFRKSMAGHFHNFWWWFNYKNEKDRWKSMI